MARLGGDEFIVGVEDVTDEAAVITLAHRLIAAISQPIQVREDLTVQVGASVGIALGRGGETDVETLLHEADLAVYRAKAAGRGCAELFSWTARAAPARRCGPSRKGSAATASWPLSRKSGEIRGSWTLPPADAWRSGRPKAG